MEKNLCKCLMLNCNFSSSTEKDTFEHAISAHSTKGHQKCVWVSNKLKGPCNSKFKHKGQFKDHLIIHFSLDFKPYGCCFCEKRYRSRQELGKHKKIHSGDASLSSGKDKLSRTASSIKSVEVTPCSLFDNNLPLSNKLTYSKDNSSTVSNNFSHSTYNNSDQLHSKIDLLSRIDLLENESVQSRSGVNSGKTPLSDEERVAKFHNTDITASPVIRNLVVDETIENSLSGKHMHTSTTRNTTSTQDFVELFKTESDSAYNQSIPLTDYGHPIENLLNTKWEEFLSKKICGTGEICKLADNNKLIASPPASSFPSSSTELEDSLESQEKTVLMDFALDKSTNDSKKLVFNKEDSLEKLKFMTISLTKSPYFSITLNPSVSYFLGFNVSFVTSLSSLLTDNFNVAIPQQFKNTIWSVINREGKTGRVPANFLLLLQKLWINSPGSNLSRKLDYKLRNQIDRSRFVYKDFFDDLIKNINIEINIEIDKLCYENSNKGELALSAANYITNEDSVEYFEPTMESKFYKNLADCSGASIILKYNINYGSEKANLSVRKAILMRSEMEKIIAEEVTKTLNLLLLKENNPSINLTITSSVFSTPLAQNNCRMCTKQVLFCTPQDVCKVGTECVVVPQTCQKCSHKICKPVQLKPSKVGEICNEFTGGNGPSHTCETGLYCKVDPMLPDIGKCHVLPSNEGGPCNEFTQPMEASHDCAEGLVCKTINEQLPDLGGKCVKPVATSLVTLEQVTYQGFATYTPFNPNECTKLPLSAKETRDYSIQLQPYTGADISIFDNDKCKGTPKIQRNWSNVENSQFQQYSDDGDFKKANAKSVYVVVAQA
ncbi:hypothetical protein HK099_005184 [Clydaea vesicula]|uniref:C2H2-type domain-containing protein n=1 Tax=Clydaea vesicula TaxID=447962 RepID=A0AAD5U445_9FUNG|nr:hypothetical protein HK099_005184 [Clydaea vesicula]